MDKETKVVIKHHSKAYYTKNKEVYKDCLSCAHSFSEECTAEDKLHCMLHNKVVTTNAYCSLWN